MLIKNIINGFFYNNNFLIFVAENFPYIPHTCYLGEKLCEPLAKDCAVYSRLRDCCCDRYALEKCKYIILISYQKDFFFHKS